MIVQLRQAPLPPLTPMPPAAELPPTPIPPHRGRGSEDLGAQRYASERPRLPLIN